MKPAISFGAFSFSEKEIKDIIIAWLALSFAFGMLIRKDIGLYAGFIISSLTVGIGFIAHELGHKIVAQHYGAWAEFRAWTMGLVLAVAMSFAGFILAAPGAVMVAGRTIGKSRFGKVAAAGPVMSYAVALCFLAMKFIFTGGMIGLISHYGFFINTWLGLFNMIPIAMLDGAKIWRWDKRWFFGLVAVGLFLLWQGL